MPSQLISRLENSFRNFSCLTKDEIITISYNDQLYEILVMEIKPEGRGISIIETDLEVPVTCLSN